MIDIRLSIPCAACLLLVGCDAGTPDNGATAQAPSPAPTQQAPPVVVPTPTSPAVATPPAPDGAEAAADVVRRYHALIAKRRYGDAYRLWEPGSVGATEAAFAARFVGVTGYRAVVGVPGRIDSGAGQRYVEVPVRIAATAGSGEITREGAMTLHRVADIDGATLEQQRWRIRSSDVDLPASDVSTPRTRSSPASVP